ncbi:MAG TPA: hypothetical protein PKH92_06430 [Anaerolineaceae bacterium]|nr:hypothetical protein [Anaerolineaceae bacterium]
MPNFTNRVHLQGFLEIDRAAIRSLGDQVCSPVLWGWLHSGTCETAERHRIVISDRPAVATLEILRRVSASPQPEIMLTASLDGAVEAVALNGRPLVSIEGALLSVPGKPAVVDVKWISFLTVALNLPPDGDDYATVRSLGRVWDRLREKDRQQLTEFVRQVESRVRQEEEAHV